MFFKSQKRSNFLIIDTHFVSIKNVESNGSRQSYVFELKYQIPIEEVFKNNAYKVRIKVFSKVLTYETLRTKISSFHGSQQNIELLKQLQNYMFYIRNNSFKQENYTLATINSDITAYINNQDITLLNKKVNLTSISNLTNKKLVTKQISNLNEENTPVFTYSSLNDINVQQLSSHRKSYLNMIMHDGQDPSYIVDLPHKSLTARQTTSGLIRKSRTFANEVTNINYAQLVANSILFDTNVNSQSSIVQNENSFIQTFESVTKNVYEITEEFKIDELLINNNTNFSIQFEVIDTNNIVILTTTKQINLDDLLLNYFIPKKSPIVNVFNTQSFSNIEIKNIDKLCKKVRVYKKVIYTSTPNTDDYTLVGDFDVQNQIVKIQAQKPINTYVLYRVIPIGQLDSIGNEYTNIVLYPSKIYEIITTSIITKITNQGILIEARNLPDNVVAVQFLSKNITRNNSSWTNLGNPILITQTEKQINLVSIIDSSVKHNHIYEYAVSLIFPGGITKIVGNSLTKFIKQQVGIVATNITNIKTTIDNDTLNVSFNFKTELLNSNIDVIRSLLVGVDLESYFKNDIEKEKSFFKNLITHLIIRKNLTTGEQETFNIVMGDQFNDIELQKQYAVKSLNSNCQYRYEIYPLLRSPDTLLENLVKTVVDKSTNKEYKFSPSKYHHPLTLNDGIILTQQGRKLLYPSDEFIHGIIGNLQTVDISFDSTNISITDLVVSKISSTLNKITWKTNGSLKLIDHFLIIKDVNGVRTFIGKSHSNFNDESCFFFHSLTQDDNGTFKYVIIPILNSYNMGLQITSDIIEVD